MQLPIKRKLDKYLGWLLIGIFLPPTRLLGILLRRNHGIQEPPRQILFIKLLGLGSLVLASDSIKAMRRQWPDTRFILLTDSNIADGIAPFHLFDEIWSCRSGRLSATLADALRFLRQSWKRRKLWVADLEVYSKLTTAFALLTFARNRFGFSLSPVFFRKYLNTHNVPFDRLGPLEDNYVYMARAVTGTTLPVYPALKTRRDEYRKPYIVLNNTCSELAPHRKLPEQTFSQICQWILDNTSYRVALLGAVTDREAMNNMIERHS
ncbi:MAG TPA: hypothetical protein VLD19_17365, partial [Chitinophagaceae bacterium]|nr:hypothetical protein [Chitinophagaceae bacterium]